MFNNLKKLFFKTIIFGYCLITISIINIANSSAGEVFRFDPMHSSVSWQINHFGFSYLSGKFSDVQGKVILDESNYLNSSVEVVIKIDSLSTGLKKFDEHLLSSDFFDVNKFSTAKFVSRKVIVTKNNNAKILGSLTIRGVKRDETIDVKLNKIGENPLTKTRTVGFTGSLKIKRSNYGINYGMPNVADEVKIEFNSELTSDGFEGDLKSSKPEIKSQWKIIADKSKIEFTAKQNDSEVKGQFKSFIGSINFDPNDLKHANCEIKVDMTSLDMSYSEALEALKTANWLAIKTFPFSIFRSEKFIASSGLKQYRVYGNLEMKGKTIPLNLDFTIKKLHIDYIHVVGKAIIKRSDFDIGDNDLKKSHGVANEVEINFEVHAQK
jgi:polyisoprenoid-binding protein YceI